MSERGRPQTDAPFFTCTLTHTCTHLHTHAHTYTHIHTCTCMHDAQKECVTHHVVDSWCIRLDKLNVPHTNAPPLLAPAPSICALCCALRCTIRSFEWRSAGGFFVTCNTSALKQTPDSALNKRSKCPVVLTPGCCGLDRHILVNVQPPSAILTKRASGLSSATRVHSCTSKEGGGRW